MVPQPERMYRYSFPKSEPDKRNNNVSTPEQGLFRRWAVCDAALQEVVVQASCMLAHRGGSQPGPQLIRSPGIREERNFEVRMYAVS